MFFFLKQEATIVNPHLHRLIGYFAMTSPYLLDILLASMDPVATTSTSLQGTLTTSIYSTVPPISVLLSPLY